MHTRLHTAGFTLLDTVIWVSLFIIVMLAITQSVLFFYRANTYVLQEATAISATQQGLDAMMRIIRETSYSSVGAYPVIAISTSSYTFYADIDNDAVVERVRYYLSGELLYRATLNPSGDPLEYSGAETASIVTEHIKNNLHAIDVFTYYDEEGSIMSDYADIASVRFVSVHLAADVDPNRPPLFISLRSSSALRNLID